jgi:hypothetical protein
MQEIKREENKRQETEEFSKSSCQEENKVKVCLSLEII